MKLGYIAIVSAALTAFAAPSFAATFTSDQTCSAIGDIDPDADACYGSAAFFDGGNGGINDSEDLLNNNVFFFDPDDTPPLLEDTEVGLFNENDWQFAQRININDDGDATSTEINIGLSVDAGEGTWGAVESLFSAFEDLVIVLKAGNTFAAYLYSDIDELVADIEGTFNTNAFPVKDTDDNTEFRALSHITAYVRGEGDDTPDAEVPLPAAGWMLLAGVGGLAAMRRRKKA